MLDCLKYLIGLSQSDCACYQDSRPVDYNSSLSGYYLGDDFELNLNLTTGAEDCEKGTLWNILEDARTKAIKDFIRKYAELIPTKKDYKYADFKGEIGLRKNLSIFSNSRDFVGIEIDPQCRASTRMQINGFYLNLKSFTPPIDVTVFVYSDEDLTTPIASKTVTLSTAGSFTYAAFDDTVILDLNPKIQDTKYYVVYEVPATATIIDNVIDEGCGCGGKKGFEYEDFADVNGIESPNIAGLTGSNIVRTGQAYGLVLDAYTNCDYLGNLCDLASTLGTVSKDGRVQVSTGGKYFHLGQEMAAAIGHRAAAIVADKLIKTRNVNRISLLDRDVLYGVRSSNEKHYQNSMMYIIENLPDDLMDCHTCKRSHFSSINSIF